MRHYTRFKCHLVCLICLLVGAFGLGRYSAYGAGRQIPMTSDQFMVGMGMVKVTMDAVRASQQRIIAIAQDQSRGRYTRTQASQMIEKEVEQQENRVSAALMPFLSRNAIVSKEFTVEPGQLPEDILNTIEFVQTKYPVLFNRYMN